MKIALVHDYLNEAGGAEKVLRVLSEMYPQAPIYTAFAKRGTARQMFADRAITESPWAWFLKIGRFYSYFRFVLPWVWRSVDLTKYDLVITSCSGYIARGFRVLDSATIIAYCHTPPKWLYGYETPTGAGSLWWGRAFMWVVGPFVRYFDYKSAERVNGWIANSLEVAKRIDKFYRKKAIVVYPPIEMTEVKDQKIKRKDYFLVVARQVGAKGIEEAVRGATRAGVKLKVVGEKVATLNFDTKQQRKDIEFLGRVNEQELARLYAEAKGLVVLARDEDFGMTVPEAMRQGTPVLALNSGGYKETVINGKTGIMIEHADPETVAEGIRKMQKTRWDEEVIKKWARNFGRAKFEKAIREIVSA